MESSGNTVLSMTVREGSPLPSPEQKPTQHLSDHGTYGGDAEGILFRKESTLTNQIHKALSFSYQGQSLYLTPNSQAQAMCLLECYFTDGNGPCNGKLVTCRFLLDSCWPRADAHNHQVNVAKNTAYFLSL